MKDGIRLAIVWDEITYDNQINLDEALRLYDESFPLEVKEPHQVFLQSLSYARTSFSNTFRFLVGFEENKLVALATGHYLVDVNCGFIVYIATNPSVRNKGLGGQTLLKLEQLLVQDAHSAGKLLRAVILETEKPEIVHTETERIDCIKRNRFFERNGYYQLLDINYLQPPLREGEEKVPLNLFLKNLQENTTISSDEIREIISAVYREKYGSVNRIDARILSDCLETMGIDPC